jgi:hypothetical protein
MELLLTIAKPVLVVGGIIGGVILWYMQVRQAGLEIAALEESSNEKDRLIQQQEETIRLMIPDDNLVVEYNFRKTVYTKIEKHDPTGESLVFDVENFEDLEDLNPLEVANYADQIKDYSDEIKRKLTEYPSNKYL